jgi:hypothetical protein
MIRWNHGGWQSIHQLSIPLLAGHHHHLFKRQSPAHRQKPNGFAAGCPLRQNIEKPVTTQMRLSL